MPKRTRDYEADLLQRLRDDPGYAVLYLRAALDDEEEHAEATFLLALRDVAKAHRVSDVAEATGLNRETLYRTLSQSGNPSLASLRSVLKAVGMKLSIDRNGGTQNLTHSLGLTETRHIAFVHLGDEGTCPIADTFRDVVAGQSFTVALGARTFEPTAEALNKAAEIENNQDLGADSANIMLEISA